MKEKEPWKRLRAWKLQSRKWIDSPKGVKLESFLASEKPFEERFEREDLQPAEKEAKLYFENKGWKYNRFGWDRAQIDTWRLPNFVRFLPDYIVQKNSKLLFYEVKGSSSYKKALKIKENELATLIGFWNEHFPVHIFVHELPAERNYDFPIQLLIDNIESGELRTEHDGAKMVYFPRDVYVNYLLEET